MKIFPRSLAAVLLLTAAGASSPALLPQVHAQSAVAPEVVAKALPTATAGDILVVANGTYKDQQLEWRGTGAADRPVTVRAETPGGVIFSGKSSLKISGEHVTVEGFLFADGYSPVKEVISIDGSHCTLRQCAIDSYNPPPRKADDEKEDKWVALRGDHHRVEYCTFFNKTSPSVTLTVWREDGEPDHHAVVGCHFHTRPKGANSNGYETIRIGTSETADSDSKTLIEACRFDACDGEMEIISVKAGSNIVRGNSFVECAGTVTLRHGNGTEVANNVIAGKRKKETGGIRVYGERHRISGNTIIGTTGRGDGAIALMSGESKPKPGGYQPVADVIVRGNLLVANSGPAFQFAAEYSDTKRPVLPQRVLVDANTLSSDDQATLVQGLDRQGIGINWQRNQVFLNNQIPREFTQDRPGLIPVDRVESVVVPATDAVSRVSAQGRKSISGSSSRSGSLKMCSTKTESIQPRLPVGDSTR